MSTQDACQQRKLFLQFSIPPSRLTKQSPYDGTVTQDQLNMRRKAEILKYKTNSSGGSSGSQKQNFARLARGNYNIDKVSCTADAIRPVSTRNSNIPGPEVFLYEDPNVPLYNYFKNTNIGAIGNTENETQWNIYIDTDRPAAVNTHVNFATLVIRDAIAEASLLYRLEIPVSFYMSGSSLYTDTSGCLINITDISPYLVAKYNGNEVRTFQGTLENTSLSVRLHPTTDIYTSNGLDVYNFAATIFTGHITYSDVLLFTAPGNVYTLDYYFISTNKLDILTNEVQLVNSSQTTVINNIYFGLIINESSEPARLSQTNCVVENTSIIQFTTARIFTLKDSLSNGYTSNLKTAVMITYIVSVNTGINSYGEGNKYYINGVLNDTIQLLDGYTYKLDLSDISNDGHSMKLSTTPDGIHGGGVEYTQNVIYSGTDGTAGAYLYINIDSSVTLPLYYYCNNNSGMGSNLISSS